jgi:hypothetical protein
MPRHHRGSPRATGCRSASGQVGHSMAISQVGMDCSRRGAAADQRDVSRHLRAQSPGRVQQGFPRGRGFRRPLCRIMASAGTSSQRSSTRLRRVFSSDLVDQLVEPQRAEQRIAPQTRHDLSLPGEDSGLRTAEQLIAAERDHIRAGFKLSGTSGSSMPNGRRSTTQPLPRSSYTGRPRSRPSAASSPATRRAP